jgi:hypothetical protein
MHRNGAGARRFGCGGGIFVGFRTILTRPEAAQDQQEKKQQTEKTGHDQNNGFLSNHPNGLSGISVDFLFGVVLACNFGPLRHVKNPGVSGSALPMGHFTYVAWGMSLPSYLFAVLY